MGLWPTQGDEKRLGSAATLYEAVALSFVIPSEAGFPTSPLSPATTYVVLSKENHMQLIEAATLDRKSGEAEGSAVRHSCAPPLPAHNLSFVILPAPACRGSEALRRSIANRGL